MSRIESEIANELNLEIGDIVIVIKKDGNIKNVVMPEMNLEMQNTISYQKLLKVLDVLKPGASKEFENHIPNMSRKDVEKIHTILENDDEFKNLLIAAYKDSKERKYEDVYEIS